MASHRTEKFGGPPANLPQSDLPTFRDIAKCFWKASETEKTFKGQVKFVEDQLLFVWRKCSTVIPLLSARGIRAKLERFLDKVKSTSITKKCSKQLLDDLNAVLDQLFDIAGCTCELPIAACRNVEVNCRDTECGIVHILCRCEEGRKVPAEERAYMRDQRAKVGTFGGQMQMTGRDTHFQPARDR